MITNLRCFDCKTNSPCQDYRKCIEKSMENMDTDVRGGKGYVEFCFSYSYSNCYSILSDWLSVLNSHNSEL